MDSKDDNILNGHRPMSLDDEFPGWEAQYWFEQEPNAFTAESFEELLLHCARKGASDITLQTEEAVYAYVDGRNLRVTKHVLNSNEIEAIVNHIYGSGGVTFVRSGEEIDDRLPIVRRHPGVGNARGKIEKMNFRINVTGCWARGDDNGMQITARTIKSMPPTMAEMNVESAIVDAFFPENGLVLVNGPTGSGKSTLLAAGVRSMVEDPDSHRKIITGEAPIEYTYDDVPRASAIVSQHEIPRHVRSFARFVRNTLRRAPKVILVGESRDAETVEATLEAAQTGHTVYSTLHTKSVPSTTTRMANMFPPSERMTKLFEIIDALRLVVVQRLVRRADGKGRVPVREFLVFDQTVRDHLRAASSVREVEHILNKLVDKRGQSMLTSAQRLFDQGIITIDQMNVFERESKADLIDDMDTSFA